MEGIFVFFFFLIEEQIYCILDFEKDWHRKDWHIKDEGKKRKKG